MANFGFRRLSIVAPFAMNWMEAKSAVGAPDLLREAKVYETLAEALAHTTLVLGTGSLDKRKPVQTILTLPEAATEIRAALQVPTNFNSTKGTGFSPYINSPKGSGALAPEGSDPIDQLDRQRSLPTRSAENRIALLFGSEKHGLTTEDLSWCHALIVIDTHEDQPSMNLGQAVAVTLYEISRTPPEESPNPPQKLNSPEENPNSGQLDRLASLIEETMEAVNYTTRGMRSANGEALRVLLRRLMPNEADLRRMMGLFRRILWQLRRQNHKP